MPLFKVEHLQAVWERAFFIVEADDEDAAREMENVVECTWKNIEDTVEFVDSEIVSVEPYSLP
jgi:ribosome biogenesis protein Tsr3